MTQDAGTINALLDELRTATHAIDNNSWLDKGLAGEPKADLRELSSTQKPLTALDSAGAGFLTPMISFLEEPLNQLRGNPDGVRQGAGEFEKAGTAASEPGRGLAVQGRQRDQRLVWSERDRLRQDRQGDR